MQSLNQKSHTGIALLLLLGSCAVWSEELPYRGNISAGFSQEKSRFPVLRIDNTATFQVSGQSEVLDTYKNVTANLALNRSCGSLSCSAELSIDSHLGQGSAEFNTQFTRANAGFGAQFPSTLPIMGGASWGLQALVEDWRVANTHFRTVTGGLLNLIWIDESQNATLLSGEFSRFRHLGENTLLDSDYRLVSLSHDRYLKSINTDISMQLSYSDEKNVMAQKYLDNGSLMSRFSIEKPVLGAWRLGAAVTFQKISFSEKDPVDGRFRHDNYLGRELFVEYALNEKWKLRGGWADSKYASNIAAFENRWSSFDMSLNAEF